MNQSQRQHLEQQLLRERDRAIEALASFDERARVSMQEDDGDITSYPLHPADEGTDTIEKEQSFLLASKEGRQLYAIDEALRTLYKEPERYGRCTECGAEIEFERLDIVPWAKHCMDCQRAMESRAPDTAA